MDSQMVNCDRLGYQQVIHILHQCKHNSQKEYTWLSIGKYKVYARLIKQTLSLVSVACIDRSYFN